MWMWILQILKRSLAQQQVVTAAVIAYLDVLQAQEQLRAVEEDVRLAQQLTNLAQHQLEVGIVTNLDVIRAADTPGAA